ncbi:MAG: FkbM family methyltransferase [Opitutaceae bacterium]|nr:FkbM family methyltransferase [Opitutaceae bacterium]
MYPSAIRDDFIELCQPLLIGTIYECGSRDAIDGCELASRIGAQELHVFECNPAAIALCHTTLNSRSWSFTHKLNPVAVSDHTGVIGFLPVVPEASQTSHSDGNIGASSIFQLNKDYPHEHLVQRRIEVPTVTLDDYMTDNSPPDLLWLDVQGAELLALRGAVRMLARVKVIHLEIAFRPVFENQPLFSAIDALLRRDFRLVRLYSSTTWWKSSLLRLNRWVPLTHWLGVGPWFTDAVYIRRDIEPA